MKVEIRPTQCPADGLICVERTPDSPLEDEADE